MNMIIARPDMPRAEPIVIAKTPMDEVALFITSKAAQDFALRLARGGRYIFDRVTFWNDRRSGDTGYILNVVDTKAAVSVAVPEGWVD